jgi:hypothetical protein
MSCGAQTPQSSILVMSNRRVDSPRLGSSCPRGTVHQTSIGRSSYFDALFKGSTVASLETFSSQTSRHQAKMALGQNNLFSL